MEISTNEASIPNKALEALTPLVGEWKTVGTHPMVPGAPFHGHTSFAWDVHPHRVTVAPHGAFARRLHLLSTHEQRVMKGYRWKMVGDEFVELLARIP